MSDGFSWFWLIKLTVIAVGFILWLYNSGQKAAAAAIRRKARFDHGAWSMLLASDSAIAAAAGRLRRHGTRYEHTLAAYLLASADRKNLDAVTEALLAKARSDAEAARDNTQVAQLATGLDALYRSPTAVIARQRDGSVIVEMTGRYEVFESAEDYREAYGDWDIWEEVTDPAERRLFVAGALDLLVQVQTGRLAPTSPDSLYDASSWGALVESNGVVAASADRVRPYGEAATAILANYALASGDTGNLNAIADAIIARAQADGHVASRGLAPSRVAEAAPSSGTDVTSIPARVASDSPPVAPASATATAPRPAPVLARNIMLIYETGRGPVAQFKDGRVLAEVGGKVLSFKSLDAYRQRYGDQDVWRQLRDRDARQRFVETAAPQIERMNASLRV